MSNLTPADMMIFANDAYRGLGETEAPIVNGAPVPNYDLAKYTLLPAGYKVLQDDGSLSSTSALKPFDSDAWAEENNTSSSLDGLFARTYINTSTQSVVIAFRGSTSGNYIADPISPYGPDARADWLGNNVGIYAAAASQNPVEALPGAILGLAPILAGGLTTGPFGAAAGAAFTAALETDLVDNITGGLTPPPQLNPAIRYVQAVQAMLAKNPAYQGFTITLTGHSLGGGLASLISAYTGFDATVFEALPVAALAGWIENNPIPAVNGLTALPAGGMDYGASVTNYYLRGEMAHALAQEDYLGTQVGIDGINGASPRFLHNSEFEALVLELQKRPFSDGLNDAQVLYSSSVQMPDLTAAITDPAYVGDLSSYIIPSFYQNIVAQMRSGAQGNLGDVLVGGLEAITHVSRTSTAGVAIQDLLLHGTLMTLQERASSFTPNGTQPSFTTVVSYTNGVVTANFSDLLSYQNNQSGGAGSKIVSLKNEFTKTIASIENNQELVTTAQTEARIDLNGVVIATQTNALNYSAVVGQNDLIVGTSGNDFVSFDSWTNSLTITLDDNSNYDPTQITTSDGNLQDVLCGIATVVGSSSNDTIYVNGSDTVYGGGGNDHIYINSFGGMASGGDPNACTTGATTLDLSLINQAVTVDLGRGTAQASGGGPVTNVADIQDVIGNNQTDYLAGNAGDNTFITNGGYDTIWGGGGNDTVALQGSESQWAINISVAADGLVTTRFTNMADPSHRQVVAYNVKYANFDDVSGVSLEPPVPIVSGWTLALNQTVNFGFGGAQYVISKTNSDGTINVAIETISNYRITGFHPLLNCGTGSPGLYSDFDLKINGAGDFLGVGQDQLLISPNLLGDRFWVVSSAGIKEYACDTSDFAHIVGIGNYIQGRTTAQVLMNNPDTDETYLVAFDGSGQHLPYNGYTPPSPTDPWATTPYLEMLAPVLSTNANGQTVLSSSGVLDRSLAAVAGQAIDPSQTIVLHGVGNNNAYLVDDANTIVQPTPGSTGNEVDSTVSYQLGADVQTLRLIDLTGTHNLVGRGNDLDNTMVASSGTSTLFGGSGNNTLVAGSGTGTLVGGSGHTQFVAGIGATTMIGTGNNNLANYANFAAPIKLANGVVDKGNGFSDSMTGIQTVKDSNQGGVMAVGGGVTALIGGSGSDSFLAGAGNDSFQGGSGSETLSYAGVAGTIVLTGDSVAKADGSVDHFSGIDLVIGNNAGDLFAPGADLASIIGGSGNDTFEGGAGSHVFIGGGGSDLISYQGVTGGLTLVNDLVTKYDGSTDHLAGIGAVIGTNDGNTLSSSADITTLVGGSGNDTLIATTGSDVLTGGGGADQFIVSGASQTTLTDFAVGDSLDIVGANLTGMQVSTTSADNSLITLNDGQQITIDGHRAAYLSATASADGVDVTLLPPSPPVFGADLVYNTLTVQPLTGALAGASLTSNSVAWGALDGLDGTLGNASATISVTTTFHDDLPAYWDPGHFYDDSVTATLSIADGGSGANALHAVYGVSMAQSVYWRSADIGYGGTFQQPLSLTLNYEGLFNSAGQLVTNPSLPVASGTFTLNFAAGTTIALNQNLTSSSGTASYSQASGPLGGFTTAPVAVVAGQNLMTFDPVDPFGGTVSLSLADSDNGMFALNGDTLVTAAGYHFTGPTASVTVAATNDQGQTTDRVVSLAEQALTLSAFNLTVPASGTVSGTIGSNAPSGGVTYSASGATSGNFSLNPFTGQFVWTQSGPMAGDGVRPLTEALTITATDADGNKTSTPLDLTPFFSADGIYAVSTVPGFDASLGNANSACNSLPVISANGQVIAFESQASNLVPGDNGNDNALVSILSYGQTSLVSTSSNGTIGNTNSWQVALSGDGKTVAFDSWSNNLAPNEGAGPVVIVKNLVTGTDVALNGFNGQAMSGPSDVNAVSANGGVVIYSSLANNIGYGGNNHWQTYAWNAATGVSTLISAAFGGGLANSDCGSAGISGNGNFVDFLSWATNLTSTWIGGEHDYLRNLTTGVTTLIDCTAAGVVANANVQDIPKRGTLSDDGQTAVFCSTATNLTGNATDGHGHVFVKNMASGAITCLTAGSNGDSWDADISGDGRFVVFSSNAGNLGPLGNAAPTVWNAYLDDLLTGKTYLISKGLDGASANGGGAFRPVISDDGSTISFSTWSTNLTTDPGATGQCNLVAAKTIDIIERDTPVGGVIQGLAALGGTLSGAGGNTLIGGTGSDTFVYRPGDGAETLSGGGGIDALLVEPGLGIADVTLTRSGLNLVIGLGSGSMTVLGQFASDGTPGGNAIAQMGFVNGGAVQLAGLALADGQSLAAGSASLASGQQAFNPAAANISVAGLIANTAVPLAESANQTVMSFAPADPNETLALTNSANGMFSLTGTTLSTSAGYHQTGSSAQVTVSATNSAGQVTNLTVTIAEQPLVLITPSLVAGATGLASGLISLTNQTSGLTYSLTSPGLGIGSVNTATGLITWVQTATMLGSGVRGNAVTATLAATDAAGTRTTTTLDITAATPSNGLYAVSAVPGIDQPMGNANSAPDRVPELSANGQKLAFFSSANNLVGGDYGNDDTFVYNLATNSVVLTSQTANGVKGNANSWQEVISGDGTTVAYDTSANNLASNEGGLAAVIVKSLVTGATTAIGAAGGQLNNSSSDVNALSTNGGVVVYSTYASNAGAGWNGHWQTYAWTAATGVSTLVSAGTNGALGNNDSGQAGISANGNSVIFQSWAGNLVAAANGGEHDYVRNLLTNTTTLVDSSASGVVANVNVQDLSQRDTITDNGQVAVFCSGATNLTSNATDGHVHVYLKTLDTGAISCLTAGSNGDSYDAGISGNGRFIVFNSNSGNLVGNGAAAGWNVYLDDTLTNKTYLVTKGIDGNTANNGTFHPIISDDGSTISFESASTNLTANAGASGQTNVYMASTLDIIERDTAVGGTITGMSTVGSTLSGAGANTLVGGSGNDTFVYRPGDGAETLFGGGGHDSLLVEPGLSIDAITLTRAGQNLMVGLGAGSMTIEGQFASDGSAGTNAVSDLRLANGGAVQLVGLAMSDGESETARMANLLVQAMAAFDPSAPPTSLPTSAVPLTPWAEIAPPGLH